MREREPFGMQEGPLQPLERTQVAWHPAAHTAVQRVTDDRMAERRAVPARGRGDLDRGPAGRLEPRGLPVGETAPPEEHVWDHPLRLPEGVSADGAWPVVSHLLEAERGGEINVDVDTSSGP